MNVSVRRETSFRGRTRARRRIVARHRSCAPHGRCVSGGAPGGVRDPRSRSRRVLQHLRSLAVANALEMCPREWTTLLRCPRRTDNAQRSTNERTRECYAPRMDTEPQTSLMPASDASEMACEGALFNSTPAKTPGNGHKLSTSLGRETSRAMAENEAEVDVVFREYVSGCFLGSHSNIPGFGADWRDTSPTIRRRSSCARQAESGRILETIHASRHATMSASRTRSYELPGAQISRECVSWVA